MYQIPESLNSISVGQPVGIYSNSCTQLDDMRGRNPKKSVPVEGNPFAIEPARRSRETTLLTSSVSRRPLQNLLCEVKDRVATRFHDHNHRFVGSRGLEVLERIAQVAFDALGEEIHRSL